MKIYIVGSGGFAKELTAFVQSGLSNFTSSETLDSVKFRIVAEREKITNFVIAIGDNAIREQVYNSMPFQSSCNLLLGTSLITDSAVLGVGNVIMNNVTIANNVTIGSNCVIHGNVVIGHDCKLGDNVFIGSNSFIGGNSYIESKATVYPGCTIKNKIKIGRSATVGIGSCVIRNVKSDKVVFGNPAKIIK